MECGLVTASGRPCSFPAESCPIHRSEVEVAAEGASEQAPSSRSARQLARAVIEKVADGEASPTQSARYLRSIRSLDDLGESDEERERGLAEMALMGAAAHGVPPRDLEQWKLAIEMFEPWVIEDMKRWMPMEDWRRKLGDDKWSTIGGHSTSKADFPGPPWMEEVERMIREKGTQG